MNPEPQDTSRLQKLLALKRHERPPPRFFNDFSDRVISRLHSPGAIEPAYWWQRLGLELDVKLAAIFAFGLVVCGLFLFGVTSAMQGEETGPVAHATPGNAPGPAATSPRVALVAGGVGVPRGIAGSTDPVISTPSASSPFNQFSLLAQRGNVSFGGN